MKSVSSSYPVLCVQNRTHRVFTELTEFAQKVSEFSLPKQYLEAVFRPFPNSLGELIFAILAFRMAIVLHHVRSQKGLTKSENRTNSTKTCSEQFEGATGSFPS